jgi:glycosyltransferase involved in cell wall biosynthesis
VLEARLDAAPRLLFVGRIAPQKRQDDLIRALAYYRRCVDPQARLLLVGGYSDQPKYYESLRALAAALDVADAVTFTGAVSLAALVAYYRTASCFLSLSQHEGFGVPLLEAMHFGLPVVADPAGAIAETVDGAGILLSGRDIAEAAEACAVLIEREDLRRQLAAAGRRRVAEFATDRVAARTREVLGL